MRNTALLKRAITEIILSVLISSRLIDLLQRYRRELAQPDHVVGEQELPAAIQLVQVPYQRSFQRSNVPTEGGSSVTLRYYGTAVRWYTTIHNGATHTQRLCERYCFPTAV